MVTNLETRCEIVTSTKPSSVSRGSGGKYFYVNNLLMATNNAAVGF